MSHTPQETGTRALLESLAMSGVGRVCQTMSFDSCRYMGGWLGLLLFGALGKRQSIAINNIRLALGVSNARAHQLARRSCMNFGMTFTEFMHLPVATEAEIRERCYINGIEHVWGALEGGRGAILLTAHLGNWELMGARAAFEVPLTVVQRPTSNAGVQRHIEASRRAANIAMISKYDTGRASLMVLRRNETLGILPDQHAGDEGALLPFFGQPTRVWTAIPRLAMLSGATVLPAFGVRRRPFLADGRIEARVSPSWIVPKSANREEAILEGTKHVVADLEKVMRDEPDQWLWLHRRWREKDGAVFPANMNRAEFESHIIRPIHEGKGFQSSVYLVNWKGEEVAVKDFARAPKWFRRFVAPTLVAREARALKHLNGTPGIPLFKGKVDRLAFALQFIEGTPISTFAKGELAPEAFPRIAHVVEAMHARGVAHGDLKRRSNLLLAPDGSIWIIDFAAAIIARGPISRKLMQAVAEVDDKSLPRLKKFVAPELLTVEDQWKLDNPTKLERWAKKLLGR